MFGAITGLLERIPGDDTIAAGVGAFATDAAHVDTDASEETAIKQTEPQLFCRAHRTPSGGILFTEPAESERWISAARTVEVRP